MFTRLNTAGHGNRQGMTGRSIPSKMTLLAGTALAGLCMVLLPEAGRAGLSSDDARAARLSGGPQAAIAQFFREFPLLGETWAKPGWLRRRPRRRKVTAVEAVMAARPAALAAAAAAALAPASPAGSAPAAAVQAAAGAAASAAAASAVSAAAPAAVQARRIWVHGTSFCRWLERIRSEKKWPGI